MKSRSFIAILGLLLIFSAIMVGSASAQNNGHLVLKGEILHSYKADIYLHAMNDVTNEWEEVSVKSNQDAYRFRLNTDTKYRLLFMSYSGISKTVIVSKGEDGRYDEWLDIDFNNKEDVMARMFIKGGYYNLTTRLEYNYADISD
jgi:hypothetical protein